MTLPAEGQGDEFDRIEAAAAEWLGRRDRGLTPDEAVEFARWRAADPRHEAAVVDLSAMWSALDDLATQREPATPTPAQFQGTTAAGKNTPKTRSRWWWVGGAAIAAGLAAVVGVHNWQKDRSPEIPVARYETEVGAQRTIALSDGSTLQLNTNSSVAIRYTPAERKVDLLRGEAFFAVAKDSSRPFFVTTDGVEARAVGTAFTVRRRELETELIVTEGRVKFSPTDRRDLAADVDAGKLAVCRAQAAEPIQVQPLDDAALTRELAWKAGRLILRPDMPLSEAAAEFNRYHHRQLVVRDAETGAVPVGGAFEIANLDGFVRMLETSFDITVVERDAQRIVLEVKH
jgi:transmembrane sensor